MGSASQHIQHDRLRPRERRRWRGRLELGSEERQRAGAGYSAAACRRGWSGSTRRCATQCPHDFGAATSRWGSGSRRRRKLRPCASTGHGSDELIALAAEYRGSDDIAPPEPRRHAGAAAASSRRRNRPTMPSAPRTTAPSWRRSTWRSPSWYASGSPRGAALAAALTLRIEEIVALTGQAEALAPTRPGGARRALARAGGGVDRRRLPCIRGSAGDGARAPRRQDRCDRGDRPAQVPLGGGGASPAGGGGGRAQARFPGTGVQPGGQYALLQSLRFSAHGGPASLSRPPSTNSVSRRKTSSRR